ncbi:MAG TPA: type 4a pilus biogenesis protein PilO [Candidatus Omnitrophota bacterium]|nr:type 4a pilus biogenesis protein PilO [Candidatus Omnitrophota bacterium]HPD84697.1 type 4a pilus biogenesis protein PilO [Candidatus Omnitrophota bacterium]HRZ03555.1 type 4a pilus biogenesis protein PilO [Candidatus Omnitrophota bacterium]
MIPRRLSKRETRIFIVCLFVIFVFVSYRFIFKPLKEDLAALEEKIEAKETQLKKILKINKRKDSVSKAYEQQIFSLRQKLSDEQEMASILSEIQSVANEIKLGVADMKPKKVKRVDFYNNFSVSLTMDGELVSIVHFLYILQNSPHFFSIDEVYFEKSSIRTAQIKCRLTLSKILIPS